MAFDGAIQNGPTNSGMLEPNLLVISDLHLGEDLKPFSAEGENPVSWLRHVVKLERALEAFLEHHTWNRQDGRPWRLIVNGDMVDFLSVCLLPTDGDGSDDDERQFGVGTHALAAVRKIESVAKRHASIFQRLSAWIAAGHELHVVLGNHDVEFHWGGGPARIALRHSSRLGHAQRGKSRRSSTCPVSAGQNSKSVMASSPAIAAPSSRMESRRSWGSPMQSSTTAHPRIISLLRKIDRRLGRSGRRAVSSGGRLPRGAGRLA